MKRPMEVEVIVLFDGKPVFQTRDEADTAEYGASHFTWLAVGMLEHAKHYVLTTELMVAVDKDGNEIRDDDEPPPPKGDQN